MESARLPVRVLGIETKSARLATPARWKASMEVSSSGEALVRMIPTRETSLYKGTTNEQNLCDKAPDRTKEPDVCLLE